MHVCRPSCFDLLIQAHGIIGHISQQVEILLALDRGQLGHVRFTGHREAARSQDVGHHTRKEPCCTTGHEHRKYTDVCKQHAQRNKRAKSCCGAAKTPQSKSSNCALNTRDFVTVFHGTSPQIHGTFPRSRHSVCFLGLLFRTAPTRIKIARRREKGILEICSAVNDFLSYD